MKYLIRLFLAFLILPMFSLAQGVGTQGTGTGPRAATATGWGAPAAVVVSTSTDRGQFDWYTGSVSYPVVGAFDDVIEVPALLSDSWWTITFSDRNSVVACSGRGCKPKGAIYTTIYAAQLLDVTGNVVADLTAGKQHLYMLAGTWFTVHVTGLGHGTGTWLGHGEYDITIGRY